MPFDAEIGSGREWAAKSSSEAAAYLCLRKAFPVLFLLYSPGEKVSVSYSRLIRKVPFGTDGFNTGSRNLISLQNNNQRPRLS
jgi:hypothetical protein